MRVLLASGSPRRRDLLTWSRVEVQVHPQDVDESRDPGDDPVTHAARLAERKARSALERLETHPDDVIVAADTVVHLGDRIFDKPRDRAEARAHLMALSDATHQVTTGVCVCRPDGPVKPFTVTTRVRFRRLTDADIRAYLQTGEADDKAGAYAIQGQGGVLVAQVEGSWTNVMGLPVEETLAALHRLTPR